MIAFGGNEASDIADFDGDASYTLAYSGTTGRLQIAIAYLLSNEVSFITPTATGVTFSAAGSAASASGATVQIWYGVSTGAVGNVTFGTSFATPEPARVWCVEAQSTLGWSAPLDATDTDTETTATTTHPTTASDLQVATSGASDVLTVGVCGLDRAATSLSTPTGYTALANIDAGYDVAAYRVDSSGTRNFSATSGAAAISAMALVAFKEDGGGGGGATPHGPFGLALHGPFGRVFG